MSDQFDEQAKRLIDNDGPYRVADLADVLRKQGKELADLRAKLVSWQTVTDYARGYGATDSQPGDLQALIESLKKG